MHLSHESRISIFINIALSRLCKTAYASFKCKTSYGNPSGMCKLWSSSRFTVINPATHLAAGIASVVHVPPEIDYQNAAEGKGEDHFLGICQTYISIYT